MRKSAAIGSLRSLFRRRDLLAYWKLSRTIFDLEGRGKRSHYGEEIIANVYDQFDGQFCVSFLRNIRPLRRWTYGEVFSVRTMAIRNAILLCSLDTAAANTKDDPVLKSRLLKARAALMKSYPASSDGKPKHGDVSKWLKRLRAARKRFGIGTNGGNKNQRKRSTKNRALRRRSK